jgi:hypothetical protein
MLDVNKIENLINEFEDLAQRFIKDGMYLGTKDEARFRGKVVEVKAFLNEKFGTGNIYVRNIDREIALGQHGGWVSGGPTLLCVETIIEILKAAKAEVNKTSDRSQEKSNFRKQHEDVIRIQLPKGNWEYDPNSPLGPAGAFGEVFAGKDPEGNDIAVKLLKAEVSEEAHRELEIAVKLLPIALNNVVPILDAGLDKNLNSYFVVMAQAEKSLQHELNQVGKFSDVEAIDILKDIASGLAEVPDIVHRDLKPGNILYHEGRWKVADFGIARFVEATTSTRTLKLFLTYAYAAPEQWRGEHSSHATDIYALGCIAYALLTGKPPFEGPNREDYQEQHLYEQPQPLRDIDPLLWALISAMVSKAPEARPKIQRVISSLNNIGLGETKRGWGGGLEALSKAGLKAAEKALRAEAARQKEVAKEIERRKLAESAFQNFRNLIETLFGRILNAAPSAERYDDQGHPWQIKFGSASLLVHLLNGGEVILKDVFRQSGWDVVAGALLIVNQSEPSKCEYSANLWFTNPGRGEEYRWWEMHYIAKPGHESKIGFMPFGLRDISIAANVLSGSHPTIEMKSSPRAIDQENVDSFCDRWAGFLAKAYHGELDSSLPDPFFGPIFNGLF